MKKKWKEWKKRAYVNVDFFWLFFSLEFTFPYPPHLEVKK